MHFVHVTQQGEAEGEGEGEAEVYGMHVLWFAHLHGHYFVHSTLWH